MIDQLHNGHIKPKRIQRKRTKGFKLETDNPLGYVLIHRPFKLGNPFDWTNFLEEHGGDSEKAKLHSQALFGLWLYQDELSDVQDYEKEAHNLYLKELEKHRGKDVVCFCKLDQACHGDVILKYWEEAK